VIVINTALVLAALILFRFGMSIMLGVHAKDELDKKDNFAFGLAVGGGILALMLIMSGAISGDAHASLQQETLSVLVYGIVGIVLLKLGFLIQDKLLIRGISLANEVKAGNISAGIVIASNLIAIGLIIRGSITWSEDSGLQSIIPVLIVYGVSQVALTAVTLLRSVIYAKRNGGAKWHDAIQNNNKAIAIRFAGQLLATALAITSVASLVAYSTLFLFETAVAWLGYSFLLMLIIWIVYRAITPIILTNINLVEEVDKQENLGIAFIEAAIFIGVAIALMGFIA
jgi:uncharacterized membrane protein YjfL (UPF0719 family)